MLRSVEPAARRLRGNAVNVRLAVNGTLMRGLALNGNLLTTPLQTSAGISDVYVMMLSFRYTFN